MREIESYVSKDGIVVYNLNTLPEYETVPVRLSLTVRTGALEDPVDRLGLAHFVEHMNTSFKKLKQSSYEFSNLCYALTTYNATIYNFMCLESDLPKLCNQLLAIIDGSYLTENNMEIVREDILEEYKWTIRSSKYKSNKLIYKGSVYEKQIPIGDLDGIKAIGRKDLQEFHDKWYRPENISIQSLGITKPMILKDWLENAQIRKLENGNHSAKLMGNQEVYFALPGERENCFYIEDGAMSYIKCVIKISYDQIVQYLEDVEGVQTKCMLDIFTDSISLSLNEYLNQSEKDIRCTKCDFTKDIIFVSITVKFSGREEKETVMDSFLKLEDILNAWIVKHYDFIIKQYETIVLTKSYRKSSYEVLEMMRSHDLYKRPRYTIFSEMEMMEALIRELTPDTLVKFFTFLIRISKKRYAVAQRKEDSIKN